MANLGTLKQRVLRKYKGSTSSAFEAQAVAAINDAIEYFNREELWFREATATLTLVAGSGDLSGHASFPTDFWFLRGNAPIIVTQSSQNYQLEKLSASEFDDINKGNSGRPRYYRELSGNIEIYPLPDTTYSCQVRYIKQYDDLVSDSDSNDWTVYAPQLIEARALASLYLSEGHDATMASYWQNQEEQQARALRVTHNRRVATGNLCTGY